MVNGEHPKSYKEGKMFDQTFVSSSTNKGRKVWTVLASTSLQFMFIATLVLLPLIFTDKLPAVMARNILAAPPLPPPPPPPAPEVSTVRPTKAKPPEICGGLPCTPKLPKEPKKVIKEAETPPTEDKIFGKGVPGGTGDRIAKVSDVIGGNPPVAPPPQLAKPEVEKPKVVESAKSTGPVRVGGKVQDANLLKRIVPQYPILAKQARVQGTVIFTAVISRNGTIQQLQLVSGHPLLVPAAAEAVKQWLYRPTMLNDEPVEVITQIDVNFTLAR